MGLIHPTYIKLDAFEVYGNRCLQPTQLPASIKDCCWLTVPVQTQEVELFPSCCLKQRVQKKCMRVHSLSFSPSTPFPNGSWAGSAKCLACCIWTWGFQYKMTRNERMGISDFMKLLKSNWNSSGKRKYDGNQTTMLLSHLTAKSS